MAGTSNPDPWAYYKDQRNAAALPHPQVHQRLGMNE